MAEAARAAALLDRLEGATLAKAFRGELGGAGGEEEAAPVVVRADPAPGGRLEQAPLFE